MKTKKEPAAKNLIDTVRRELKWSRRIMWVFIILTVVSFVPTIIRDYPTSKSACLVTVSALALAILTFIHSYRALFWKTISNYLCDNLADCALKGLAIAKIVTKYRSLVAQLREAETIDEVRTIIKTLDPETETKEPPPEK